MVKYSEILPLGRFKTMLVTLLRQVAYTLIRQTNEQKYIRNSKPNRTYRIFGFEHPTSQHSQSQKS